MTQQKNADLDSGDWQDVRTQGHRMLDDMLDYVETIRSRPVWQPMDAATRASFRAPLPRQPTPLEQVHADFLTQILPYSVGNVHPAFMGWVNGGGTVVGMLAEMLAAGLNANCGGRDHSAIEVERQITAWLRELFGFPEAASGVFVTGASLANFLAILIARRSELGGEVRREGLGPRGTKLVAYSSIAAHACIARAMDYAGLGDEALRRIPVDGQHRIDIAAVKAALHRDRAAGFEPFALIGNAGTVDIGAIDDLAALADVAATEHLWFHVDGAFGALGILAPDIAPKLSGIERADSIALDFHKWGQVPYDAGFILVRDGAAHCETFATSADYLQRDVRGLGAGSVWPHDLGPDLSRGFRALKTWMTLRVYGTDQIGASIARTCQIAQYLAARIAREPQLELLAPVQLNIVCFVHCGPDPDALNAAIVADVQESGVAVPSTTRIAGRLAIRAAIVNHRTREADVDALVDAVLEHGARRTAAVPVITRP